MNTDIFAPTAQPSRVVTNFENGQAFSAMDIFRNLFRRDCTTLDHFSNTATEYDAQNSLKSEINFMLFQTYYSAGSGHSDPTAEQLNTYKNQVAEMVDYLLWDVTSPLQRFKKEYRTFFTKVDDKKTINVDKIEEFFDIGITNAARKFATSFHLVGESQDWYLQTADSCNSCCFHTTQLFVLSRWIQNVLNVYGDAIALADMRTSEGYQESSVREELSLKFLNIQEIVEDAMENKTAEVREARVYLQYGSYTVDYADRVEERGIPSGSRVWSSASYVDGVKFAKELNKMRSASHKVKSNAKSIEDLQLQLDMAKEETKKLLELEAQAVTSLTNVESLAQFLEVVK